jgi:putative toxin-antitoxin system antitoxin component (TIGR02293 family)
VRAPSEPDADAALALVRQRQPHHISWIDWQRFDALEVARGRPSGRPLVKFTCGEEMLAALERVVRAPHPARICRGCHLAVEYLPGDGAVVTVALVAETLGGYKVLRQRTPSAETLRSQVRNGLPYASLEALITRYALTTEEASRLLRLPPRTLARRKKERRLNAEESDRLFRVGRIAAHAENVFGERAKASRWLHKPNRALGGVSPLSLLDTDLGTQEVEKILGRIEYGVYS